MRGEGRRIIIKKTSLILIYNIVYYMLLFYLLYIVNHPETHETGDGRMAWAVLGLYWDLKHKYRSGPSPRAGHDVVENLVLEPPRPKIYKNLACLYEDGRTRQAFFVGGGVPKVQPPAIVEVACGASVDDGNSHMMVTPWVPEKPTYFRRQFFSQIWIASDPFPNISSSI